MTPGEQIALVAAANRAPSVHNIQPARFRFEGDGVIAILEDPRRRLFVGDPEGRDNQKSLGAAAEGLILALSERGFGAEIANGRVRFAPGGDADPLACFAETRASYRGAFAKRTDDDHAALARIGAACPDLCIVEQPDAIGDLASLFDAVSLNVLRAPDYRAELLSWMRLSRTHPGYARDGLNAAHMALSPFEAFGARVVLGARGFPLLDKAGLAGPLIAEDAKVRSAAGFALFHRPASESEFDTGRRFHRVWLENERAGLALCPMSVLADVPEVAEKLLRDFQIEPHRKLVTVFRIGRRPLDYRQPPRARLPARELILA